MRNDSGRLLLGFGVTSLGAVAVGAMICAMSDVPASLWMRNLAAWIVGALLAVSFARASIAQVVSYVPWLAVAALAATFLGVGQDGVHRWVQAGPMNMNVAMLVLPAALVTLAVAPATLVLTWLPALAGLAILVAQPDASQATAFGLAVALIAGVRSSNLRMRMALVTVALALVAVGWLRPDPLQPVPEVEDILELAMARSILLAGAALALLAALAIAPAICLRRATPDVRVAGVALGLCLALWTATTFLGHYPVPLVGVGLSPILGAWLGVGVLASFAKQRT